MSKKTNAYKRALASAERRMVKASDRLDALNRRHEEACALFWSARRIPGWVLQVKRYRSALGPKRRWKLEDRAKVARGTFCRLFFV